MGESKRNFTPKNVRKVAATENGVVAEEGLEPPTQGL